MSDLIPLECSCGWKYSGRTEGEVKEAADLHQAELHGGGDIRWEVEH